ncbi:MAG TPA: ABC transporter permease subunit [Candidatus Polarisedimenticolia bacterium]|nr:ABC transporter permease subunit [Candidatus Polarisedimenticolia bacterium]
MRRIDLSLVMAIMAFALLFGLAAFGERLAPYEPFYVVLDLGKQPPPYPPGGPFPLGTDTSGRDLLSLILSGARVTLLIAAAAGLGRVLLGLVLASLGSHSAPVRLLLDGISEVASALPVTLVAVLAVLALAGPEARAVPFVTAMVLTGWPGPYRIARTELTRLATAPFTESAHALGLRARTILSRHHIPHLMPLLAMSVSQQMTASLVALAELGVFAIFIGRVRTIGASPTSDIPEWGGLLANARSVENLYTTRWVFLVPGLAIALAAVAVSFVGIGIANRYRRRDILIDLRSPLAGMTLIGLAITLVVAANLPDRYPEALARAAEARGRAAARSDFANALAETGFSPVGSGAVETSFSALRQSRPATITASGSSGTIALRDGPDASADAQAILYSASGGGVVDGPLVFAGWGISPDDYPPREVSVFSPPDYGKAIEKWADDYAKVDVRGKVVVILKLPPIVTRTFLITPPDVATQIRNAPKSFVAERVRAEAAQPRVMVWAVSPDPIDGSTTALDVVTAFAGSLATSSTTVTLVVFDPTGDASLNAAAVRRALGDRVPDLLLVVSGLQGDRLQFLTATPEFVPIADAYADRLNIAYQPTVSIAGDANWTWPGVSAYPAARTLWIRGAASPTGTRDLQADTAAFLAYALGRYERGAPEIRR